MSEAPPFWFRKAGAAAWLLSPLSLLYGQLTAKRMMTKPGSFSALPVLCIGNFIVGGAGKTPTAVALATIARDMGLRPGFLSRGYGGSVTKPTLVDAKTHNARDVGDEPLLLALHGPTVVSTDRPAGARLLEEQDVDIILMDDGFQNPSLHKDYALAVVDAGRGLGNGFAMPAGPLRAALRPQLARASAILLIGQSEAGTEVVRKAAKMAKPVLTGGVKVRRPEEWAGARVLAFAGIADPTKFYRSLETIGAEIVARRSFHDHHPFSAQECQELLDQANKQELQLVTTAKDWARLVRMGDAQEKLRAASKPLHIDMVFENSRMAQVVLRDCIKRFEETKLARG
ncbi:MAG: tetraacyldisaccharide 4'-kinase [Pseudomonadota bacterium]